MIAIGVAKSSGLIAWVAQKPCASPRVCGTLRVQARISVPVFRVDQSQTDKERKGKRWNGGDREEEKRREREEGAEERFYRFGES